MEPGQHDVAQRVPEDLVFAGEQRIDEQQPGARLDHVEVEDVEPARPADQPSTE